MTVTAQMPNWRFHGKRSTDRPAPAGSASKGSQVKRNAAAASSRLKAYSAKGARQPNAPPMAPAITVSTTADTAAMPICPASHFFRSKPLKKSQIMVVLVVSRAASQIPTSRRVAMTAYKFSMNTGAIPTSAYSSIAAMSIRRLPNRSPSQPANGENSAMQSAGKVKTPP